MDDKDKIITFCTVWIRPHELFCGSSMKVGQLFLLLAKNWIRFLATTAGSKVRLSFPKGTGGNSKTILN